MLFVASADRLNVARAWRVIIVVRLGSRIVDGVGPQIYQRLDVGNCRDAVSISDWILTRCVYILPLNRRSLNLSNHLQRGLGRLYERFDLSKFLIFFIGSFCWALQVRLLLASLISGPNRLPVGLFGSVCEYDPIRVSLCDNLGVWQLFAILSSWIDWWGQSGQVVSNWESY